MLARDKKNVTTELNARISGESCICPRNKCIAVCVDLASLNTKYAILFYITSSSVLKEQLKEVFTSNSVCCVNTVCY